MVSGHVRPLAASFLVLTFSLTGACLHAQRNGRKASPLATATSADGASIAYDVRGRGPIVLVFVHGWSGDRSDWQHQAEYIAANFGMRYTVVTLDLAGHGQSGRRLAGQLIPSFGNDVKAVVETLGLQNLILIGHNLGGDALLEVARDFDDRVIGLIWFDCYRDLDRLNQAQKEKN